MRHRQNQVYFLWLILLALAQSIAIGSHMYLWLTFLSLAAESCFIYHLIRSRETLTKSQRVIKWRAVSNIQSHRKNIEMQKKLGIFLLAHLVSFGSHVYLGFTDHMAVKILWRRKQNENLSWGRAILYSMSHLEPNLKSKPVPLSQST